MQKTMRSILTAVAYLLTSLSGAAIFTVAFVALWGALRGADEGGMAVSGSYLWMFYTPVVGLFWGLGICRIFQTRAAKQRSMLKCFGLTAFISLAVFAGYSFFLGISDALTQYHRSHWRERAEARARRNDPEGWFVLGINAKSTQEEVEYLTKAAGAGHQLAMLHLGQTLCSSTDTKTSALKNPCRDCKQGAMWLEKAAMSNDPNAPSAKFFLGQVYCDESSGICDYDRAMYWFGQCRKSNELSFYLGKICMMRQSPPADYAKAREYFLDNIKNYGYDGYYGLGQLSENGWGCEKNLQQALEYYQKGCNISTLCGQALLRLNAASE